MAQHQEFPSIKPLFVLVGRDGFEPSKSKTTDLQSVAFGRSATLPYGASEGNCCCQQLTFRQQDVTNS